MQVMIDTYGSDLNFIKPIRLSSSNLHYELVGKWHDLIKNILNPRLSKIKREFSLQQLSKYFPDIQSEDDLKRKINLIYMRLSQLIGFSRFIAILMILLASRIFGILLSRVRFSFCCFVIKNINIFWYPKTNNDHYDERR